MKIPHDLAFPLWMMFGIIMAPLLFVTVGAVFGVWFLDGYWWMLSPVLLCLVGLEFWISAKVLAFLIGD